MRSVTAAGVALWLLALVARNFVLSQEDTYVEENIFQGCNQTIREGHGVIMSPNFTTSTYPNNLHCWWSIEVETDRIVKFIFGHFDVESGINCQYDKVSVFNGPSSNHPKLGTFCGAFRPGQQVSSSNKLYVTMDTDASNTRRGFFAIFESALPILATEDSCGGLLNADEGSFHSPGYPTSTYPPSVSCMWHIRTGEDRIIRMNFKEFDTELSNGCKYDALVINAGWTSSEKTKFVGRFCGNTAPAEIVSEGNELFVTFISDPSGVARGFVATYVTEEIAKEGAATEVDVGELPTEVVKTTTGTTITSTSISCPQKCSKVKLKGAVCNSNYMLVVQISDVSPLRSGESTTVQVVKAFKLGSLPSVSSMTLRISCFHCFKISRAGSYVVIGNSVTTTGMDIKLGDLVVKYKERKHTKQIMKMQRRCGGKGRQRKGKKRAAKRKRESSFRKH